MNEFNIPFNKPYMTGKEFQYISDAHHNGILAGDGPFTRLCHTWLEERCHCSTALLTHSCTAALEMTALLMKIEPGDEIIMPSFTFVSTANAFVLRGGIPVFVDIRSDTLNIDETLIEHAITSRTKAIVVVHYAGVACEMDTIMSIAKQHRIWVVEDAAQAISASYKGRPLGSISDMGTYSFHETKNVISGEGGALLVNNAEFSLRAEIIREKGTDRSRFFRGEVDKYTWQEPGSSFLPGELIAAFLWAQLEEAHNITEARKTIWGRYHALLVSEEQTGRLRRPIIPKECGHNAHMYYILLADGACRDSVVQQLKERGIYAVFHYVPLHSSPAGRRYGKCGDTLSVTNAVSQKILRLPCWVGLTESQQKYVVESLSDILNHLSNFDCP